MLTKFNAIAIFCDIGACYTFSIALNSASLTHPLSSGAHDSERLLVMTADIVNICCKIVS